MTMATDDAPDYIKKARKDEEDLTNEELSKAIKWARDKGKSALWNRLMDERDERTDLLGNDEY